MTAAGKICTGLILCALFWTTQAAAREYTLGSAIERALRVNPTLEEKIHALESARMEIGVSQSAFWPRLSLVAGRNRLRNSGSYGSVDELSNTSTNSGLRATWSLFAGFAHLNNLQRARIEKDISSSCSSRPGATCAMWKTPSAASRPSLRRRSPFPTWAWPRM